MCGSRGCRWGRQKAGGRFGTSGPRQRPGQRTGSGGGTCLGICLDTDTVKGTFADAC